MSCFFRKLLIDLTSVTENAAIESFKWVGKNEKFKADEAATFAMRKTFDNLQVSGTVVIGEGEMDEAPMLYIGEKLGKGGIELDIAVDPLEGTTLAAKNLPNSLTILAVSLKGGLLHAPDIYMEKIAVGKEGRGKIDINAPIEDNLAAVAKAKGKSIEELVVVVLDRQRHEEIIKKVQNLGARLRLISDGDVLAAILVGFEESNVDLLIGSGGAPEGVLASVALKCLDGEIQGKFVIEDSKQLKRCQEMGITDSKKVLFMDDFVSKDALFIATGVTDGELLKGVCIKDTKVTTNSLIMDTKRKEVYFLKKSRYLNPKREVY